MYGILQENKDHMNQDAIAKAAEEGQSWAQEATAWARSRGLVPVVAGVVTPQNEPNQQSVSVSADLQHDMAHPDFIPVFTVDTMLMRLPVGVNTPRILKP